MLWPQKLIIFHDPASQHHKSFSSHQIYSLNLLPSSQDGQLWASCSVFSLLNCNGIHVWMLDINLQRETLCGTYPSNQYLILRELLHLLPLSTEGNTSNVQFCLNRIEPCISTYVQRQTTKYKIWRENYLNKSFFFKSVKLAQLSSTSSPTFRFVTSENLSEKKLLTHYDPSIPLLP